MNVKQLIKQEYETLHEGMSLAGEECPSCKGGSANEKTLSVTMRDGKLLFICHRASCGVRGVVGVGSNVSSSMTTATPVSTRGAVGRWIVRESTVLPPSVSKMLFNKYGITTAHTTKWKIGWDLDTDRLVLPVFSRRKELEGTTARSLSGASPKSISHTEDGAMAWYLNPSSDSLIIVEDQLSAIRASDYMNAVALLGTNINEDRASLIRKGGYKDVFIALDKDAFNLTLNYSIKYRSTLKLIPLKLEKDIKDMYIFELENWLEVNNIKEPGGVLSGETA